VARAALKFKKSVFTDPISLEVTGRRHGVELNKQMYNALQLAKALQHNPRLTVPHSRRQLTADEYRQIYEIAGVPRGPVTKMPAPRGRPMRAAPWPGAQPGRGGLSARIRAVLDRER